MTSIQEEYTIIEHPGRLQPFTVWREPQDTENVVLRFCQTENLARLFIAKDIERRLR